MTVDKRTVSTDALETLGMLIDASQKRDAIHLAVEPVIAGEVLNPGEHIGLINRQAYKNAKHIGIVDPFLNMKVFRGERFWLIIYPRQITSLRHVWSHPDFDEYSEKDISEVQNESLRWIKEFCEKSSFSFDEVMKAADECASEGYSDMGSSSLCIPSEFWDHYQVVTGKNVPRENQSDYFGCAC